MGEGHSRLSAGGFEARGRDRLASGGFDAAESAFGLSYARPWAAGVSLGATAKYLHSSLGQDTASTFALDLGAVRRPSGSLRVAAAVRNLGPGLKYISQTDQLPLTFALGAGYRLAGSIHLAADLSYEPYNSEVALGIGTEYALLPALSLRAGYTSLAAQVAGGQKLGDSPLSGLGGGIGVRLGNYTADYAFTPFGELGNVQRISIGSRFGPTASTRMERR